MNSPRVILRNTSAKMVLSVGAEFVKGKVLDVGCDEMPLKRLFPECEWTGLDVRPVADIQGDPHDMSMIEDNTYDTVICTDVLQSCQMPLAVIKECGRVLKPGGTLIVSSPNVYTDDHQSLWRITGAGQQYLFDAAGLETAGIFTEGRLVSHEWAEEFGTLHDDAKAWLDKMDNAYPQVTFGVARKKV